MGFTKFFRKISEVKSNPNSQSSKDQEDQIESRQLSHNKIDLFGQLQTPLGIHVPLAGGFDRAVDRASAMGCTAFQIFTRNPRGWNAKPLLKSDITKFKEKLASIGIDRFATFANMPYLPNLSSPESVPFTISLNSLIDEAKRCSKLGIPYLVTRLGNHKGIGEEKGIETLVKAFTKAVGETPSDVTFLLKNNNGWQNMVGSSFEQIASIFSQLKPFGRFGISLDTCHAFAAGYDLRTEAAVSMTFKKFDESIGLENLKMIYLSDCKTEIGSARALHEHIGLGKIGEAGLEHVIKFANSKKIPMILKTPIDARRDDIGNLRKVIELSKI